MLKSLRAQNIAAEIAYTGNAKKRLERANKSGAKFAILVGDDLKLKNLTDGSQQDVTESQLPASAKMTPRNRKNPVIASRAKRGAAIHLYLATPQDGWLRCARNDGRNNFMGSGALRPQRGSRERSSLVGLRGEAPHESRPKI